MKLFFLKFFVVVSLMFISALAGMQMANDGIHKMKGYDDPDFKGAIAVKENEDGNVHASLLGNEIASHDIEAKKQKLEGLKAFNMFSDLGKKISNGISTGAQQLIDLIFGNEKEE
ncbi:Protein of unknown function [Bacillus sp. cl95]|nr:Protein of unknown function [Bacillus sp. UNCCL13]SFQ79119.1 Protein of unknown function [Bacillus sp. cl95]